MDPNRDAVRGAIDCSAGQVNSARLTCLGLFLAIQYYLFYQPNNLGLYHHLVHLLCAFTLSYNLATDVKKKTTKVDIAKHHNTTN
jgi:hypothetical protein